MPEVKIKEVSANHDEDQKLILKAERLLSVNYDKSDDSIFLNVNIGEDDHHITLTVDRKELLEAIVESLLNPEITE